MESPIDLYDDIIKNEDIELLEIDDINKQIYSEILNTGEGIVISVSTQNSPIIRGGGLPYPEYVVSQIIFRWDSEHTINKEKFAMEVQTLTIAKKCMNFDIAIAKGGVAIFSTLYVLSSEENEGLNELLPIIPFICDEISRVVPYDVMRLSHFFPKNFNEFYRYTGSLTFPPFTSGVVWTIFKEKQPVTRPQMGLLCDIQDEDGRLIVCNNSASRNPKTVLFSSGKIRRKCLCLPGQRKHKPREKKDKTEVEETLISSGMYEGQQESPNIKKKSKDKEINDIFFGSEDKTLSDKVVLEGVLGQIVPNDVKGGEKKPEEEIKEINAMTQTDIDWESESLARSYLLEQNDNTAQTNNKKMSASVSFRLSPMYAGSDDN